MKSFQTPRAGAPLRRTAEGQSAAWCRVFKTRIGWCGVARTALGVCAVFLPESSRQALLARIEKSLGDLSLDDRQLGGICGRIRSYLDGRRVRLAARLDLGAPGAFDNRVWQEVARIPYGRTMTYGEVAAGCGRRGAARAVGGALGRNPVPLIVPCHRVVRGDGGLGGFSGAGGVALKKRLIEMERRRAGGRAGSGQK